MTSTAYNQTGDYVPRKDAQFREWANNLARIVSLDPQRYGLTQEDADRIAIWAGRFDDAYVPAYQSERSTPIVRAKNDMRREAETILREYAQQIKHHRGISYYDLSVLGLHIDDTGKTPITKPRSSPLLYITMAKNCGHVLHYADENTPASSRKPAGVNLIQIFSNVGDAINMNPDYARHVGDWGRQPIRINWPHDLTGKTVTYFGRWMTKKGLKGPWSLPVFMTVASGGDATAAVKGRDASREDLRVAA
jgi:hypothetical protein